jgi:hypothetical protein
MSVLSSIESLLSKGPLAKIAQALHLPGTESAAATTAANTTTNTTQLEKASASGFNSTAQANSALLGNPAVLSTDASSLINSVSASKATTGAVNDLIKTY